MKYRILNLEIKKYISKISSLNKDICGEFKKYKNADKVRDELLAMNVIIKDSSLGTEWDIVIK